MAKTFDQWMADNGFTTGAGPNYIYGKPAYNQAAGMSGDRSTAVLNWQREQGANTLADLLGGASGAGGSTQGANPFGSVPAVNDTNRFEAGLTDAETRLRSLLDNPDSIQQSAAYKFRVNQGQEALQRSLGAKGMLNSGNRLMDLTKYGQDMASQEYENQFGRLGNLLTNYSGSWIGDKNANTSRYAAQANAWNTAQGNADQNRYRMGSLAWEMQKPQAGGGVTYRSSNGTDLSQYNPGGIGGSWNPDADPTIQRMRRDSSWVYDYSQGGDSLWRNTATGETAWSPGGREGNPTKNKFYNTPAWNPNGG